MHFDGFGGFIGLKPVPNSGSVSRWMESENNLSSHYASIFDSTHIIVCMPSYFALLYLDEEKLWVTSVQN